MLCPVASLPRTAIARAFRWPASIACFFPRGASRSAAGGRLLPLNLEERGLLPSARQFHRHPGKPRGAARLAAHHGTLETVGQRRGSKRKGVRRRVAANEQV